MSAEWSESNQRRKGPPEPNNFAGLVGPILVVLYAIYKACVERRAKYARLLTDEAAFWFAVPLFGLALFYHARYFAPYRRVPIIRIALMTLSIFMMIYGFFRFPIHGIAY